MKGCGFVGALAIGFLFSLIDWRVGAVMAAWVLVLFFIAEESNPKV